MAERADIAIGRGAEGRGYFVGTRVSGKGQPMTSRKWFRTEAAAKKYVAQRKAHYKKLGIPVKVHRVGQAKTYEDTGI